MQLKAPPLNPVMVEVRPRYVDHAASVEVRAARLHSVSCRNRWAADRTNFPPLKTTFSLTRGLYEIYLVNSDN